MIDEFSLLIKRIHQANKEIEDELKDQNKVIGTLDKKVDKTENKIQNTTSKLDNYLQKSSNTCLCVFIGIEILVVILLIVSL